MSNNLFLKAIKGEVVNRPPVWIMRQAGRYLPEYEVLRNKYDFFTRVQTPELSCEITLQPVNRLGVDAAIIFSDILIVPQSMGLEVQMIEKKGPVLPKTISCQKDIDNIPDSENSVAQLNYLFKAIHTTRQSLSDDTALIGFAGAPFTLLCYMVEGIGSKTFSKAKEFCFSNPVMAHQLLSKITDVVILCLKEQVKAGADAVQVFDSWSGLLGYDDFMQYSYPYLKKIAAAIAPYAPVILYPKGSYYALGDLAATDASAVGIDWCTTPQYAREATKGKITLQGNMDPAKMLLSPSQIESEARKMVSAFGVQRYIANLGHGIMPQTPVENAKAFVDAIKNF